MKYLSCEIIEPKSMADAAVIWLHGLGASGHDFVPIVPELKLPESMNVRFVFPHAPSIPVTINGGMVMPAWYDILSMSMERDIDIDQIMLSANSIEILIEREIAKGIPSKRIMLAGFSQGGAVVYQTGLSYEKPLAGIIAMSTYFATQNTISLSDANKKLPIHIFHGEYDAIVPEVMGQNALESLKSFGYSPFYSQYPMEHSVHPQEIKDISICLQKCLLPI